MLRAPRDAARLGRIDIRILEQAELEFRPEDARDGVVMSGLFGRSGMRVYAKPVEGGRSSHGLTTEEATVIAGASGAGESG